MKSKVTKLLGVVVTVATLASMLVGFAIPANAAVGTMDYGVVAAPSNVGNVLGGSTIVPAPIGDPNPILVGASADGKTIFAWDEADKLMYKSTDGGVTFGKPVAIATASAAIDIKVSPNFATDKTVVLIDATEVWWTTNGGTTYAAVAPAALATMLTGAITSVDVSNFYSNNSLSIVIGVRGTANNVLMFTYGGFAWTAVGTMTSPVIGVRFSPNHMNDSEIMCVFDDGATLVLATRYAALGWGTITPNRSFGVSAAATSTADIEVASDYIANNSAPILIGVNGTADDDIYRVTNRGAGAGTATDLDVAGDTTTETPVAKLSVGGPAASAVILWTPPAINIATGPQAISRATGLVGTFTVVAVTKQPTAVTGSNSYVIWTSATTAIAVVNGADGGVSVSTDSGSTWNQTALMNVGTLANLTLADITVVDANTIFLVMGNTTGGAYALSSIFKTADGGATWQRIATNLTVAANLVDVVVSPSYATDTTLIITDGSNILKKSTNGGASFTALFQPAVITASIMVNGTDFYTGTTNGFYKSGRFTNATGLTTAGDVFSIARNTKDATNLTFAIGTTTGLVFQTTDGGVSFAQLGTAAVATGSNYVAYGPDGVLYAAGTTSLIKKWTGTAWLDLGATPAATGLAISPDGTLYASDATPTATVAANGGIWRALSPTAVNAVGASAVAFEQMRAATFPGFATTYALSDMGIVSTATDNTLFVIETTTNPATNTYGYNGRIYGIKDTFIVGPVITAPANNALLTTPSSATVIWNAIAGAPNTATQATNYALSTNTASTFDAGTAVAATYTAGDLTAKHLVGALATGTKYYIKVKAIAPVSSRSSATFAFTTALNPVAPLATDLVPAQGGTGVSVNPTFSWPAVAGASGYEFVIAQETGQTDKFAIIDASSNIITNAYRHTEQLKYNTTYWWRVRPTVGDVKGDWKVFFFSTEAQPVEATATATTPPIIITTSPPPEITLSIPAQQSPVQVIPSYLLWAVVAVGAILVIAVIVLIVRTRRIS